DRDTDRRVGRGDAQIARGHDAAAGAGGEPFDLRNRRLGDALQPSEHDADLLLVVDRILRLAEALELRDVRARYERFAAGAFENEDAHLRVGIHLLARADERVVHRPCHRVTRLWTVEGQKGKWRIDLEQGVGHVSSKSTKTIQPRRTRRSRGILWSSCSS